MSERPRDDASRYTEEYTDGDFLEAIRDRDLPTTGEVANAVGCSRSTAFPRLQALEDEGEVVSRKIGNANVWEVA